MFMTAVASIRRKPRQSRFDQHHRLARHVQQADQVKGGKLFGSFVQYGYDTAPVTGASLQYTEGKPFNPAPCTTAVVKEVTDMAAKFEVGALKIVPTDNDARSGG